MRRPPITRPSGHDVDDKDWDCFIIQYSFKMSKKPLKLMKISGFSDSLEIGVFSHLDVAFPGSSIAEQRRAC